MTNQLIPVFESQINNEINLLCNARELHAFLQVGKRFASWITERIKEYGFVENQDFIAISQNREIGHGRGKKDYHLTLDTAKEIAMVERNDKGREIRRYFIECEKRLRASFNKSTTNSKSTADDRTPLRDAINLLVSKKHILYPEAYSYVHQRFNVKHIDELKPSILPIAIEYVHRLALDGELLEAETKLQPPKKANYDRLIPFSSSKRYLVRVCISDNVMKTRVFFNGEADTFSNIATGVCNTLGFHPIELKTVPIRHEHINVLINN